MKLHLPVALLAAVLQAVSLQAATPHVSDSQSFDNGAKYSYSTDETGTVTSTVTGDVSGISFTTTSAGNPSAGGWVVSVDDSYVNANGEQWTASNSVLNIGDENGTETKANMVIGGGVRGTKVAGDKITNVYDGASVGNLIAGYFYPWGKNTIGYIYSESGPYYDNGATNEDAKILLNITGGSVGAVYGNYLQSNAFQALHVEQGWTAKEDIQIDVSGGNVGVILGAGYNVAGDNSVLVNLSGDAQTGDVYAGALTWNTTDSYVGSTRVTVAENAIVNGSVYGGGAYEAEYDYDSYVTGDTLVELKGGTVKGNVYGGGEHGTINGSTTVVLNGGAVTGNVYGAGIANSVEGGTRVEIHGQADEAVAGKIYGAGTVGNEVVEGADRVLAFDNHGEVDWDKYENFNVVEFTGTTTTKLGVDGKLASNYEKVVINNSYITGSIGDDHEVELDVTNNIKVALDGNLTTKAGSEIVDNENAIQIGGNATFKGTEIENSTIKAGGNICITSGSTVTDANLVATNGLLSVSDYSTIEGGEITVGKQGLSIVASDVKVDKINGVDELLLDTQNDWSLEVNDDLKLAEGSALRGFGLGDNVWAYGDLKADSVSIESVLKGALYAVNIEATDGDIVIGSGNDVQVSHLTASDSVVLKDGVSLTHGSTATALTGDVWLNGGVKVENSDLIAENGIVKFNQSTMNGGNIVAGEALQMDNASVVVADSINNGKAVKLDVNSGAYLNFDEEPTAASLTVNSDLVLADGSKFEGHNKVDLPGVNIVSPNNKDVDGLLTAHSIKSEGAVTFERATVKAEKGNIELIAGSEVTNTNLVATDSVQLTGTTMKGGSIDAGNKVVLNESEVSVNSIGKSGSAVVESTKSQLEVTQGALVLDADSVVKDSVLSSKEGVELRGTTMTGSTVQTNGTFSVIKGSDVTMDSVEDLKKIEISDSSFTTGKVELSQGESITSQNSNFTATDIVVNGGAFAADGTIKANSITVSDKGTIQIGDAAGTSKTQMELNNAGSVKSGVISGKLNVTNTNLVLTDSKAGAFWIDGGVMTVDGKSTVDLSNGGTLCVGRNDDGVLNVQGGSSLTGADNNLWVYGDSTINVTGPESSMGVCKTEGDYNYRVLMGITNHDGPQNPVPVQEQNLNVKDGGTFTSSATQFVTNFHGNTTTNISVSGPGSLFLQTGQNVNNGHYVVGTTGEWVQNADGKWLDKGSTGDGKYVAGKGDTITYLLSNGTDKDGVLGYAVSNAKVNISATEGGRVQFDSALTYVGNVGVNADYINANKSNYATFTVGKDSSMSFKQMEVYTNADVKNDGTFSATNINVNNGGIFNYAGSGTLIANSLGVANGGIMNLGSDNVGSKVVLNVAGSGQSGVISGKLNVTNTDLVVSGGSSQFWIDGGEMTVDGKSKVDLSAGTTLRVGNENAGVLNVQGGSTLIGGANNLWVYGNSTINVSGEGTTMGVCNDTDYYNYRVLMGITNHDGPDGTNAMQKLNVTDGATFTSSATQFVTNFHSGTKTFITADGGTFVQTGTNKNGNHYEVGTTGEWKQDKDGNWLDTGSAGVGGQYVTGNTDTITYLLSNGTDKDGVLGYPVSNAQVAIGAINGGTVKFDSALTYVGNVGVSDEYIKANEENYAHFGVDETSNMSFKQMEVYANAAIQSHYTEGKTTGTFTATGMNIHNGANVSLSAIEEGAKGSALVTGHLTVNGKLDVIGSHLNVVGSSSQVAIGYGDSGIMNVKDSVVDISNAQTLHIGYDPLTKEQQKNTQLNIVNSTFKGGSQNAWLGGGTINVADHSTMEVCTGNGTSNNYRVLMGLSGNTVNLNVTDGSTFKSEASRFVTNYQDGSTVNIVVDNSTFTQAAEARVGKDKEGNPIKEDSITYLADRGVDNHGKPIVNETYPQGLVNNVETNITAKNGGVVNFESKNTYIGNALDREYGYTNKQVNLSVGEGSSMSFNHMEIFADTKIDNQGTFNVESVNVNDGATLETLGSLDLNEVALAGGTLFNQGSLSMDSLELEHASLLFAATSLTDASAAINYTGTHLTNFGANGSSVSIDDMVDNFGIVLTGAGAQQLIDAGETGVAFSFTLADYVGNGESDFESQLALVLNTKENLADFSITVGSAILRQGDGELKDLKVEATENGVVISGTAIIPEPTTATLSLLALAALAARRRRK